MALRAGGCFLSLGTCLSPDVALLEPVLVLAGTPGTTQTLPQPPATTLNNPWICVLGSFGLRRQLSWRAGGDPQPPVQPCRPPVLPRPPSFPGSHAVSAKVKRHTVRVGWAEGCGVGQRAGVVLLTLVCFIPQAFSLLLMWWCWDNTHRSVDPPSSSSLCCCRHSSVQICSLARTLVYTCQWNREILKFMDFALERWNSGHVECEGPCVSCKAVLKRAVLPRKTNFGAWKVVNKLAYPEHYSLAHSWALLFRDHSCNGEQGELVWPQRSPWVK